MFLVDSSVLLDVLGADPKWGKWSRAAIRVALVSGSVGINPVVYGEISVRFQDATTLDAALDALLLERLPLPYDAAFLAARAFLRYRRSGGPRRSPLPDFFIGAHAQMAGFRLLTRDLPRVQTCFPSVSPVSPRTLH